MYKIALLTAHIGYSDKPELIITPECEQELKAYGIDIYRFNNDNVDTLKPFFKSELTKDDVYTESADLKRRYWINSKILYRQKTYPTVAENYNRLIAKLPKMMFHKLLPAEYDYYIWCDSKFTLLAGWLNYVLNLIEQSKGQEMIVSKHSERSSVKSEYWFMAKNMMLKSDMLLLPKYNIAEMSNQVHFYLKDKNFVDTKLFELPLMIYSKEILAKKEFLEEWYAHNYYFTIQDQLSLPYLTSKHHIKIKAIEQEAFELEFAKHNHY